MFLCEYYEIFHNNYFEKQLQTTDSVHSLSKLEKWEMENIKLIKAMTLFLEYSEAAL